MRDSNKQKWSRLLYTLGVAGLLLSVVLVMMMYVYDFAEKEAFEILHRDTYKIKNDINLQMLSDRENLQTMASFASKLYMEGESYDLLFKSFNKIGLIDSIGILTDDDKIITKKGIYDGKGKISFADEKEKGTYISGRMTDVTNSEMEVVRSVVPIKVNGNTVAMLYGIVDLKVLEERYKEDIEALDAKLYIIEGESGRFVVDTKNGRLGNITELAANKYRAGFSYDKMLKDITNGDNGYAAFFSRRTNEYMYVHYSPLNIADWRIMLSRPEVLVLQSARKTAVVLLTMFAAVVIIMIIYLGITLSSAEKKARVNMFASEIRKKLLTYNSHNDGVNDALRIITELANARSSFFVDTYSEDYHYISDEAKGELLEGEERQYFILALMNIFSRSDLRYSADVRTTRVKADKMLERTNPEFYKFLVNKHIQNVVFANVVDDRNNISLIGTVNAKKTYIDTLINNIAVCFAIAIYNKKHLIKTEEMALTDSLTKLENRMAYKENIKLVKNHINNMFSCIYIDVNELHYFNNQFGHAAGDQMLYYIAEVLKDEFSGEHIYRMGGDEFLIFVFDMEREKVKEKMENALKNIEEMKYHISYGIAFGSEENKDVEAIVFEAEKNMFVNKSEYYQNKEYHIRSGVAENVKTVETGNADVDALLSIMSEKYLGVYSVSLDNDRGTQIIAPEYYFAMDNDKISFSEVIKKYIHDVAKPEFHRVLMSFISYDAVKEKLKNGHIPHITYIKSDGGSVNLSIYPNSKPGRQGTDTIWVFEGMDEVESDVN